MGMEGEWNFNGEIQPVFWPLFHADLVYLFMIRFNYIVMCKKFNNYNISQYNIE